MSVGFDLSLDLNDDEVLEMEEDNDDLPYTTDSEPDDPTLPSHTDFIWRISQYMPEYLRNYLNNGTQQVRMIKFGLLLAMVVVFALAILLLIVAITLLLSAVPSSPEPDDNDVVEGGLWQGDRLPTWASPTEYRITLTPNLDPSKLNFVGQCQIDITMSEKSDLIVLNSADLTINSITLVGQTNPISFSFNDTFQYLYLSFETPLSAGSSYTISISYEGDLRDDMAGFYKSSYTDDEGNLHWLASTQFEPTDARRAFPCFDEPQMKAHFVITLVIDSDPDIVALSNMPEDTRTTSGGKATVKFQQTPLMSTYLVAFIIGEFERVTQQDTKGRQVSVWAPLGQNVLVTGTEALASAIDVVEWFEGFFGIDYALPKLDLIAIPDFSAGAMENWGLITYRLTALLYDPLNDSAANRQRVATVVSHELAHQWTGDLVTMNYWGHLWLNEGFADFFETESIHYVRPTWNMRDQFLFEDQQQAFSVDSLMSTHPVVMDPKTENDIEEMFDTITYSKGGSVLRMLQSYLNAVSPSMFQQAMHDYLTKYTFSNTWTDDFLASCSTTSGKDVATMFHEWLYEPGYPLISAVSTPTQMTLTASRFLGYNSSTTENVWHIPVDYFTSTGQRGSIELSPGSTSKQLSVPSGGWVKLNAGQNGYYRVNYDTAMWSKLQQALEQGSFTAAADRAGLVNDALILSRTGKISSTTGLNLACFLSQEEDYTVWASAMSELDYIGQMLAGEAIYANYQQYMQYLLEDAYYRVGWTEDGIDPDTEHNDALLRSTILYATVANGYPEAVNQALLFFDMLAGSPNASLPADIRSAVYWAGLHYEGLESWEALFQRYLATDNAAEKVRILLTLGATREYSMLNYALSLTLDTTYVRDEDHYLIFSGVTANPLGRDLAWDFLRENFEQFNSRGFHLSRIIDYCTRYFSDQLHLDEVTEFFDLHPTNGASIAVEQAKETIQNNMIWLENNLPILESYSWSC